MILREKKWICEVLDPPSSPPFIYSLEEEGEAEREKRIEMNSEIPISLLNEVSFDEIYLKNNIGASEAPKIWIKRLEERVYSQLEESQRAFLKDKEKEMIDYGFKYSWNIGEYMKLVEFEEYYRELREREERLKNENLFSELIRLNISRECEEIMNRVIVWKEGGRVYLEKKGDLERPEDTLPISLPLPPSITPSFGLVGQSQKIPEGDYKVVLESSIPSLFAEHCKNRTVGKRTRTEDVLKPIPRWISYLSNLFSIFYIFSVRTSKIEEDRPSEEEIEWLNPEEKWFYYSLPRRVYFFDKFREKYIDKLVRIWDEPETFFYLTMIETVDEVYTEDNILDDKNISMRYDEVGVLNISSELRRIDFLIRFYDRYHKIQSRKEYVEDTFLVNRDVLESEKVSQGKG